MDMEYSDELEAQRSEDETESDAPDCDEDRLECVNCSLPIIPFKDTFGCRVGWMHESNGREKCADGKDASPDLLANLRDPLKKLRILMNANITDREALRRCEQLDREVA